MKILDLINDDLNFFHHITFFKELENVDDYYKEFLLTYYSKELTSFAESIYRTSGLEGLGNLFHLKSKEWVKNDSLIEYVEMTLKQESGKETVKNVSEDMEKDGSNVSNISDDDFMVAFDSVEELKQGSTSKEDSSSSTEKAINLLEDTTTEKSTGFDDLRIHAIMKMLKEQEDYRFQIYSDIADTITLKTF